MLQTDSVDYNILKEGVRAVAKVPGLTCEIGLRAGGGSEIIMRTLKETNQNKTHIAIDPYGDIKYQAQGEEKIRLDYTNKMRNLCMIDIHKLANELDINFLFFPLEDTEFFMKYDCGVPVYKKNKRIEDMYSFVFFDGPHSIGAIMEEFDFFNPRASIGAIFVFDDINMYDHKQLEENYLFKNNWKLFNKTNIKASYIKE